MKEKRVRIYIDSVDFLQGNVFYDEHGFQHLLFRGKYYHTHEELRKAQDYCAIISSDPNIREMLNRNQFVTSSESPSPKSVDLHVTISQDIGESIRCDYKSRNVTKSFLINEILREHYSSKAVVNC